MSEIRPKADIDERNYHVRFVPKADSCTAAKSALFDQLVGCGPEGLRHRQSERPRGLCIDNQLKFSRLHDRQIGWFFARFFQDRFKPLSPKIRL